MEVNKAMQDYSLYALPFDAHGVDEAPKHRFYKMSISGDYILVYTDKDVKSGVEILKKFEQELCFADKTWLKECNRLLALEYIEAHPEIIERNNLQFLEELEKQLNEVMKEKER